MELGANNRDKNVLSRLEMLRGNICDAFGDSMGVYLLETELRRLQKEQNQLTRTDMDTLINGLRTSISPMIGQKGCEAILSCA